MGIEPAAPAYDPGCRPDVWVAFYRDPDGNRAKLLNGTFPPPQDALPECLT
ncbi:hypothetical protein ABZ614_13835 [Streptomyces sp. NPDC013178]|uniref:hypothetical protein n=1 Tax=Streptomyces sp. NPDC013178 TaxID=3155118 RepID=UPI0034089346